MPRYFFILGRNPELSIAELHAVLPANYTVLAYTPPVFIAECPPLDVSTLIKRLGGTIKVGELVLSVSDGLAAIKLRNKKLFIGLSAYALHPHAKLPTLRALREQGIELKRALQTQNYKVRLVTSKELALSSVIVKKEKLLNQGAEIVIFYDVKQFLAPNTYSLDPRYIGKTLAVQEFEEASIRDFGRPEREMKVGMLPVQLAKIMINLSRTPLSGTILDPFCGFGTVLSEALAMGYTNLVGSDLEQKMIDATRKNLAWLNRITPLRVRGGEEGLRTIHNSPQPSLNLREGVKLIATPVEELSKHLPARSVDTIVTEPYMGPTGKISNFQFPISNIVDLYIGAFREFAKVLKPDGRVVFIFPAFKQGAQLTKTSDRVLPEIKKLGFQPIQLLPNPYSLTPSPSITYSRPDQRVLREIFVLNFKP